MTRVSTLTLIAAGALVAGCGQASLPGGPAGGVVPAAEPVDAFASHLPSSADLLAYDDAEQRFLSDCMTRSGMPYRSPDGDLLAAAQFDRLSQVFAFGVSATDPNDTFGFAELHGARAAANSDPNASLLDGLPAADVERWYRALLGDPDGPMATISLEEGGTLSAPETGCYAEVRRAFFGSVTEHARLSQVPGQFRRAVLRRVETSPAVASSVDAWASCIAKQGFEVSDPSDLLAGLREALEAYRPEGTATIERSAFEAARTCDAVSDLHRTGWAELQRVAADEAARFGTDLAAFRAAIMRAATAG